MKKNAKLKYSSYTVLLLGRWSVNLRREIKGNSTIYCRYIFIRYIPTSMTGKSQAMRIIGCHIVALLDSVLYVGTRIFLYATLFELTNLESVDGCKAMYPSQRQYCHPLISRKKRVFREIYGWSSS